METAGVEPAPPRCKRGALPSEPRPPVVATSPLTSQGASIVRRRCRLSRRRLTTNDQLREAWVSPEQKSEAVQRGPPRRHQMRTGGVEPPQRVAARLQAAELANA